MKLDDFRVGVVPGNGIVARFSDALVIVPLDGPLDQDAVDRLLDECRKGSLGPRLADLRTVAANGVPSFAVVAEVDGGLAVHVEGDAHAAISGAAPTLHLSGRAPGWSNVFRQPFASLAVGRDTAFATGDVAARLDFKAGVVTGSGAVLVPVTAGSAPMDGARPPAVAPLAAAAAPAAVMTPVSPAPAAVAAAAASASADATAMPTEAVAAMPAANAAPVAPVAPATPAAPTPVAAAVPTAGPSAAPAMALAAEAPPATVPMAPPTMVGPEPMVGAVAAAAPTAPAPPAAADPQVAEVWGVRCKKGHFNDPEARYCAVCGIHMVQDKAVRVRGPRPVLGYLVFDDGKTYKLDTDYVIGRAPHGHEAVVSGHARPLVFGAGEDVISEVHARIVLRDWDVLVADCHSVYGTYVWAPGAAAWERLADDQPVALSAGSQVMLAQRGFMFQPVNKR